MNIESRVPRPGWPSTLFLAGVGCLGVLPAGGSIDAVRVLVLLALWAPAAGWASSGNRSGWLIPLLWLGVMELALSSTDLERFQAWMAIGGLFLLGRGLGLGLARERGSGTVVVLLLTVGLAVMPGLAGALAAPWPVEIATRLLDGSPVVVVCESAGVDWMRRPGVYDSVGCDRFARESFATSSVAGSLLAVGALLALIGAFRARRSTPSIG